MRRINISLVDKNTTRSIVLELLIRSHDPPQQMEFPTCHAISMTTVEEDHVIQLKAPEQLLNEPCGETVLPVFKNQLSISDVFLYKSLTHLSCN